MKVPNTERIVPHYDTLGEVEDPSLTFRSENCELPQQVEPAVLLDYIVMQEDTKSSQILDTIESRSSTFHNNTNKDAKQTKSTKPDNADRLSTI